MIKILLVLCIPLLVSGCGVMPVIPPLLTYFGYIKTAVDGVSYVTTQKGTTDHVISYVREEDCALHRIVMDDDICKIIEKEPDTLH